MKFRVRLGLLVILAAMGGSFAFGAFQPGRQTTDPKTVVFGADTGKKYHKEKCDVFATIDGRKLEKPVFQAKMRIKMTLEEATVKYKVKGACKICNPPILVIRNDGDETNTAQGATLPRPGLRYSAGPVLCEH